MAIKIGGTSVVNNSRQLQNIASLDSTTASTIGNSISVPSAQAVQYTGGTSSSGNCGGCSFGTNPFNATAGAAVMIKGLNKNRSAGGNVHSISDNNDTNSRTFRAAVWSGIGANGSISSGSGCSGHADCDYVAIWGLE